MDRVEHFCTCILPVFTKSKIWVLLKQLGMEVFSQPGILLVSQNGNSSTESKLSKIFSHAFSNFFFLPHGHFITK